MNKATVVEAKGKTYRQIGRCIGEALKEAIANIVLKELKIPTSYMTPAHQQMLERLQRNLSKHAPNLLEEMQGIAEASGLSFRDILTYNCIAEMWRVKGNCTAIGFCDAPEGVLIGKTNDIGEGKEHYHVGHRFTFPNGFRALIFTWPGTVWGNAGVNEEGLGWGGASVPSEAFNEDGLPSNTLHRLVLERCRSVEEALNFYERAPFMCHPFNAVLGDGKGRLVAVERDVKVMAVHEPSDGALFVTNHWCAPYLEPFCTASPALMENSRHRYANLQRLVREIPHTLEGMKRILQDHSKPGAICQHGDDEAKMHTSVAYIVVPAERAILFAYGKPCSVPFERFVL